MNKSIDWSNFKCRCSAISKMMATSRDNPIITEKQTVRLKELEGKDKLTDNQTVEMADLITRKDNGLKVVLADGCIDYLMEVYAWETQGMIPVSKESLDLMATRKGKMVEVESGIMLSIVDGVIYKQHKERISNDYLTGEIDFYTGESVYKADVIVDTKNAFDYPIFLRKVHSGLENGQKQQVQGYCDISNSPVGYIANTLLDNPYEIIEEMKWKVAKRFNAVTTESPDFLEEWAKWERSMIFSHIPPHQRVHKIKIEPFTEFEQKKVYDRVKVCREWLNNFHETYQNINK
jgi:hypothetical protein